MKSRRSTSAVEMAANTQGRGANMGQAQPKRRAVLIVEDDADLRGLTVALLEEGERETIEGDSPLVSSSVDADDLVISQTPRRGSHEKIHLCGAPGRVRNRNSKRTSPPTGSAECTSAKRTGRSHLDQHPGEQRDSHPLV